MNRLFTTEEGHSLTDNLRGIYVGYRSGLVQQFPTQQIGHFLQFDTHYTWLQKWVDGTLVIDY